MRPSPGRVLFLGSKRLGLRILEQMAVLRPEALVGAIVLDDREDGRSVFADFESTFE
jgi:predicted transcriptional regulator